MDDGDRKSNGFRLFGYGVVQHSHHDYPRSVLHEHQNEVGKKAFRTGPHGNSCHEFRSSMPPPAPAASAASAVDAGGAGSRRNLRMSGRGGATKNPWMSPSRCSARYTPRLTTQGNASPAGSTSHAPPPLPLASPPSLTPPAFLLLCWLGEARVRSRILPRPSSPREVSCFAQQHPAFHQTIIAKKWLTRFGRRYLCCKRTNSIHGNTVRSALPPAPPPPAAAGSSPACCCSCSCAAKSNSSRRLAARSSTITLRKRGPVFG
jgi:hypothetical protein